MKLRVVLVLGHNLGWRTYARTLVDALERRDDVDVVVVGGGQAAGGGGRGRATAPRHREATRLVRDLRMVPSLRRTVRAHRPHLVHAAGHLMARPLRWSGPTPTLSLLLDGTARQSDVAKGATGGIGRLAWHDERRLFARAQLINCVSSWAASSVVDDYQIPADRVRVRPYPIADVAPDLAERVGSRPRRSGRSAGRPQLLFVGGDFERKGGPFLLEAFARHWADRAELDVVSDTAPRTGLPPGVRVHPGVDNQRVRDEFFPAADLLVHPTRFDQSSMVAIEAAAFSLPAVVTDVGGVGEVVADGETGFVTDDDASFVAAVDDLVADGDRRRLMGAAARRRFLDVHEADSSTERLVADWCWAVDQSGSASGP
ncbi:MAG: glycosyltransferase family 4 protein [Acidimicrobiia bacterium]|nr:glycosyltransferase family 4 protein [Acidimicrobiia bacterium]